MATNYYHSFIQNPSLMNKYLNWSNRNNYYGTLTDSPIFQNFLRQSSIPGQAFLNSGQAWKTAGGYGGYNSPLYMNQPNAVVSGQQQPGWDQLASIADQLRNAQVAKPTTPGVQPPAAPIDYVSSDRLSQGKGFSKFQRQARGSDRYAIIKQLIDQYYK